MKTITFSSIKMLMIATIAICFSLPGKAQTLGDYYANIEWQLKERVLLVGIQ